MKYLLLLIFYFRGLSCLGNEDFAHTIFISPSRGQDSPECLTSSIPCSNLTWVLQHSRQDSTNYILSQGRHNLTSNTPQFENLEHLAFTGLKSGAIVTCFQNGLAFFDVRNVSFYNIAFTGCAAPQNSTNRNFAGNTIDKLMVGLYFYLCEDISMLQVSVTHSPNAAGVAMYDISGTNTFLQSNFTDNTVTQGAVGGGGFYVEFTYCAPGVFSCDTPKNGIKNVSFTFTSCKFSSNKASNSDKHFITYYVIPHHANHLSIGCGGGLSLIVKGTASLINFTVVNCTFVSNVAQWGGGFFVGFQDSAHSNTVSVSRSKFIENRCLYSILEGMQGGGMRVGHYVYGLDAIPYLATGNSITIEHSEFTNNSALHGGGLAVTSALQISLPPQIASIHLFNCTFQNSTAKVGSALFINRFGNTLRGEVAKVFVKDCSFSFNTIDYAQKIGANNFPYQTGMGAVHIDEVPVSFLGNITFHSNTGSALSAIGTVINFTNSSVQFLENHGYKGAAIALLGTAYLLVSNGTWMEFESNSAINRGGGIYNMYVNQETLKSDSNCFIRHTNPFLHPDDWNATFSFRNNTDLGGSHENAIHSTSILPCLVPGGSGWTNNTYEIFCWKNWFYDDRPCLYHASLTSDIGKIAFTRNQNNIRVYSGWPFPLPIKLQDDLEQEIKGAAFQVTYDGTKGEDVYRSDSVVIRGPPDESVKVRIDNIGDRMWRFDMEVDIKPCPAGFSLKNSSTLSPTDVSLQCYCSGSYKGAILCDEASRTVRLLNGMWLGTISQYLNATESDYVVMNCPFHFCQKNGGKYYTNVSYSSDPDRQVNWDAIICRPANRMGINCGECIEGYGTAVNSLMYDCVNCTDIHLAENIAMYIATTYLPLVVLFTVLIVFNIPLTTGPANAFILFCQMVTSTFDLNVDGEISGANVAYSAYQVPFNIFNLKLIENFIPPICFSPNFSVLTVLLLDYAVALSPLIMILVAVFFLKMSECCCSSNKCISVRQKQHWLSFSRSVSSLSGGNETRTISDALLPAFASFLLLSYNKFSSTSFKILILQSPIDEFGNQLHPKRVYYASQYSYQDKSYRFYYYPAISVLLTVVMLTPLLLLHYPLKALEWCIWKVRVLKKVYPNDKVHLFLNMFQGCYRSKVRFFAGLYFLFRLTVNISHVLSASWLQQLLVQNIATLVMIVLLVACQPYEWALLNYVDTFIFANLAILNSLSFFLYSFTKIYPEEDPPLLAIGLQYFFVFLPLVYMVSYIIWAVTRPYHLRIKAVFEKLKNHSESSEESLLDDSMFVRAEDENTYAHEDEPLTSVANMKAATR